MREKAKEILLELKAKDKVLSDAFDEYVNHLKETLEIPKEIAVSLVTSELVSKYEKDLIMRDLFSKITLESIKK